MRFMSKATESRLHKSNPERSAMLSLGVTILLAVLGQAVWLDGKIERVDARLGAQIEGLHAGQAAIRERLAALEARVGALDARIGTLEVRVGALDTRVGALESRIGGVGATAVDNGQPPDFAG